MITKYIIKIIFLLILNELILASASKLKLYDYMMSGAIATATTDFILYPIDTIKVMQQSSRNNTSFQDAYHSISKNGVGGFFNGAVGYATLDGCSAAIFFSIYEEMKYLMSKKLTGAALGLASYPSAAVAFAASTLFLVPAEFIKTRMQTSHFKSVWDCIKDSTSPSQGGFWGLYSGYSAILVRDLPYFALQLGCYDNIKNILNGKVASSFVKSIGFNLEPNGIELFSSIAAGFITGFLTNPMDVVTARLITQQEPQKSSVANPSSIVVNKDVRKYKKKGISRKKDNRSLSDSDNRSSPNSISNSREELSNPVNQKYSGLVDCIRRMSQEEGIQGFFLGVWARVAWIMPFTAISLGINERVKRQILVHRISPSKPFFRPIHRFF